MKLSEERKEALYNVIYDAVMDARVEVQRLGPGNELAGEVDQIMFGLPEKIWRKSKEVLNIE